MLRCNLTECFQTARWRDGQVWSRFVEALDSWVYYADVDDECVDVSVNLLLVAPNEVVSGDQGHGINRSARGAHTARAACQGR